MLYIATHKEKPKFTALCNKIPVRITYRPKTIAKSRRSPKNLIRINHVNQLLHASKSNNANTFAVPKFMFINICSLTKMKNRVRVIVALESDLIQNAYDIDICVVTETHLRSDVPDRAVHIPNYTIFRRDRNWRGPI